MIYYLLIIILLFVLRFLYVVFNIKYYKNNPNTLIYNYKTHQLEEQ
jgi:NhaP-type Na+/H+ or K+/H+ antiporter